MSIINVRDNENKRWNRNQKEKNKWTKKYRNEQGGTEAIVKGWELSDVVVHLSHVFSN